MSSDPLEAKLIWLGLILFMVVWQGGEDLEVCTCQLVGSFKKKYLQCWLSLYIVKILMWGWEGSEHISGPFRS